MKRALCLIPILLVLCGVLHSPPAHAETCGVLALSNGMLDINVGGYQHRTLTAFAGQLSCVSVNSIYLTVSNEPSGGWELKDATWWTLGILPWYDAPLRITGLGGNLTNATISYPNGAHPTQYGVIGKLDLELEAAITLPREPGPCRVGPMLVELTPSERLLAGELSEELSGIFATGAASAHNFAVPAITESATCPASVASTYNKILALPSPPGASSLGVDMSLMTEASALTEGSGGEIGPEGRVTNYVAPQGAEISPEEAATVAARYAAASGDTGEALAEVAKGPVTQTAQRIGNAPQVNPLHPEGAEWLVSSSYLVQVAGSFDGLAGVPVPKGKRMPSSHRIGLILDAHTGRVEGMYAGESTLELHGLDAPETFAINVPVTAAGGQGALVPAVLLADHGGVIPRSTQTPLPSPRALAQASSLPAHGRAFLPFIPPPPSGRLRVRVIHGGPGARVTLILLKTERRTARSRHGIARLKRLPEGHWQLVVRRRGGRLCARRVVRIGYNGLTRVRVRCRAG